MGSPVHSAVAHDDVAGPQAVTQLGRHREQPHPRRTAGCELAGRRPPRAYKALHQPIELLQGVQGPHQLGGAGTYQLGGQGPQATPHFRAHLQHPIWGFIYLVY